MDLYEELLGLVDALEAKGIDYALCGGIAVAIHGYARFTKDIDLLIREEDRDRVRQAVADRGFVVEGGRLPFGAGGPFAREVDRVSKVQGQEVFTLDLLLLPPFLEDVWKNREVFEWKGRRMQVVSAEGLAKMKRIAGRDQDLLDLKKLGLAGDTDEKSE
jgi:hypothetical protein